MSNLRLIFNTFIVLAKGIAKMNGAIKLYPDFYSEIEVFGQTERSLIAPFFFILFKKT